MVRTHPGHNSLKNKSKILVFVVYVVLFCFVLMDIAHRWHLICDHVDNKRLLCLSDWFSLVAN